MGWRDYGGWAPYVPVAQRRRQGAQKAKKLLKKGQTLAPINITKRAIATTFWGKGWCEHLERYSDFANRLPRGRTYARNGSILDLQIASGQITALVCGSDLYKISIKITPLDKPRWKSVCSDCSQSIHSVIDLMRGKLSDAVIERLTDKKRGVFPEPNEIKMSCSCPDYAGLCKHLAAVLYGVGHRLDTAPELLFVLRGVNQADLVAASLSDDRVNEAIGINQKSEIASEDLGEIFGIELSTDANSSASNTATKKKARRKSTPKSAASTQSAVKPAKKTASTKKKASKRAVKKPAKKTTASKPKSPKRTVKKFSVAAEISKNFKKPVQAAATVKRKKAAKKRK